jgi:cytochrome c-550 PedF
MNFNRKLNVNPGQLLAAGLMFVALAASAANVAQAPVLDRSSLAPLGEVWRDGNPYRGNAQAIGVGKSAFNQSCARCHGVDASAVGGAPAPDLRQLNRYCRGIGNPVLQAACMLDNDQYFKKTVQQGKVVVGVRHMPAWKDVLLQEDVWAIQAFIESTIERSAK